MSNIKTRLECQSHRLITLSACSFARTVQHLLKNPYYEILINKAEQFVDGLITKFEIERLYHETYMYNASFAIIIEGFIREDDSAIYSCVAAYKTALNIEKAAKYAAYAACAASASKIIINIEPLLSCIISSRLNFENVPIHIQGLAKTIYDNRDWSLMPILADALEEIDLIESANHCRQIIHAKGCHVLDSILKLY